VALDKVLEHIERNRERWLEILFTLLRQPSISMQDRGVRECADLLVGILRRAGIESRLIETPGHPVVLGEVESDAADAPTVLFYGHYDVQPPEPFGEWESPPFEPTVRDGRIFARGAGDNKGQLLAHVLAVSSCLELGAPPPVNVKYVFEGEEENGSPHLAGFVEENREALAADLVYTADGGFHDSGRPVVCFGVRGLLAFELEARGARSDVHSGNRGNVVPNPAWELVDLLRTMRDPSGRVLVEGFYDDVREPTDLELQLAASMPFDREGFLEAMGLSESPVKDAADYGERLMFQPTFNIAGFTSGYAGRGVKTIIPSNAILKMDVRLIADQRSDDIFSKIAEHVARHAPGVEIRRLGSMEPSRTSPGLAVCRQVIGAVEEARGQKPVVMPSLGGSLPDYVWTRILGVPSILVPYANPDENNHAPNENIEVEAFFTGIKTTASVLDALGRADPTSFRRGRGQDGSPEQGRKEGEE
jgi:acetylornithine deacetylase/succinyl-diaminopimelate desuccinylase-like protein